jgi:hypothetical protein
VLAAGGAGGASATDPVAMVKECLALYTPRWSEAAMVLAGVLFPFAVLSAVAAYVPVIGSVLSLVGSIGYMAAYLLFGLGAAAEYSMRLAAGVPIAPKRAWQIQRGRMFPWFIGILLPLVIAGVGCAITGILFGLFLLPIYMIEQRKGFAVNSRSLEISSKNWVMALVPALIVAIPMGIASSLGGFVLGILPFVGPSLAGLFSQLFSAAVTPLLMLIQFRVYFALLAQHENVDATQAVRSLPA